LSAEIYVGKNVGIMIQIPVEYEDVYHKLTDLYDFRGITNPSNTHRASVQESNSEPTPSDAGWSEFANGEYDNIEFSDDVRHSLTTSVNGNYALMLFRFKCAIAEADVKKIVLTFEGYGEGTPGNGVTVKVWNHVSSAWENAQTGSGSSDEEVKITLTSNLSNYIDGSGFIYLLARTTNADDGTNHMTLYCDYVKCFVTQAKFTVDYTPISDRNMNGVANEITHVTVKKNGVEITVSSVDDNTGEVFLANGDFNETDKIICSYRYDSNPYIAQELRMELEREIQGIDGLGSDEIQIWALLLKNFGGTIREIFRSKDQINRFLSVEVHDEFNVDKTKWHDPDDIATVEAGLFVVDNANGTATFKDKDFANFRIKTKVYLMSNWPDPYGHAGIVWRCQTTLSDYRKNSYLLRKKIANHHLVLSKAVNDAVTDLVDLGKYAVEQWYNIEIINVDNRIYVYINDVLKAYVEDNQWSQGRVGVYRWGTGMKYEHFHVESLPRGEYGIIVSWDDGQGHIRKIGLDGVTFPSGSLPTPKNEPVFVETPFQAKSAVVIS